MEACAAYGIPYEDYLKRPGSPIWVNPVDPDDALVSKCEIVVWYRMRNLIRAIAEDVAVRKARKK
jgi:hypothetical protein